MIHKRDDLPYYTLDEALARGLVPPAAFGKALGIKADTVRRWGNRGHIKQRARGPKGIRYYRYDEVIRHAERDSADADSPVYDHEQ